MATKIKKGQFVTLSTTEGVYELDGDTDPVLTTVTIVLVSGTLQFTVTSGPSEIAVLNPTYSTYSTAAEKIVVSMSGTSKLRMKCASAGVVNISW